MSPNSVRRIPQVFIRGWATADATVDSCSWVHDNDYTGVEAGHYDVAFSYKPESLDEPRRGQFRHCGNRQIAPYHTGEQIPIRYNPKNPGHFLLSGTSPSYEKLEAILVMALFALIAGYLLFTF